MVGDGETNTSTLLLKNRRREDLPATVVKGVFLTQPGTGNGHDAHKEDEAFCTAETGLDPKSEVRPLLELDFSRALPTKFSSASIPDRLPLLKYGKAQDQDRIGFVYDDFDYVQPAWRTDAPSKRKARAGRVSIEPSSSYRISQPAHQARRHSNVAQ